MPGDAQRIDKWLWFCRFVKSRSLAQGLVEGGCVRVNRQKIERSSHTVKPGDIVTLTLHGHVRVVRVLESGDRRGPSCEAQQLYESVALRGGPREGG